jgi:hypothetical protein
MSRHHPGDDPASSIPLPKDSSEVRVRTAQRPSSDYCCEIIVMEYVGDNLTISFPATKETAQEIAEAILEQCEN